MRHTLPRLFLLLCFVLASCAAPSSTPAPATATPPPPTPTRTASPTPPPPTPMPTATQTPPPTATPEPQPAAQYRLDLAFDYALKRASVTEEITYTNKTTETLGEIKLAVPPAAYPNVFTLQSLAINGAPAAGEPDWEETFLTLPLADPLQPGGSALLDITYQLDLPSSAVLANLASRPVPFGYSSRQANLVDWYPFVPPYVEGAGWLAHPKSFYGESFVYDEARFDVALRLTGEETAGITVAASAKPEAQAEGDAALYRLYPGRSFAFSFSDMYQTETLTQDGVEVTSYFFANHAPAGEAAPRIAADAMSLYGSLLVPYPRQSLAVVEAEFLDGMEYDGLVFISKGMFNLYNGEPGSYLTAIVAHETAHQWWYGIVGNDQAMEPWLDEALCTYAELLYYEKYAPEALAWWWDVRINYYNPRGWVNSSVYDQQGQGDSYEQYRNAVYLNGAVFVADLRKAMGDEAFFAALKDYAQAFEGKIATGDDFFAIFAWHTDADLAPIRQKYFK